MYELFEVGSATIGKQKRKKCWWCHSTKPHQMGNVDLFDTLTRLYFI